MEQNQAFAPSVTTALPLAAIRGYQVLTRSAVRRCRFYPSCSDYAREALLRKGLMRGLRAAAARLLKCHPWHPGGYDPVPKHN